MGPTGALRAVAPFAEYALTAAPGWLEYEIPGGSPVVLTAGSDLLVSRRPGDGIFVRGDQRLFGLGWGGTRNHSLSFRNGAWCVNHMGHQGRISINGVPWDGATHRRALTSGDRVEPAAGLVFTFTLRPELEALASALEALRWSPAGDGRVLADWVMEQTGFDVARAQLACRHLATRTLTAE